MVKQAILLSFSLVDQHKMRKLYDVLKISCEKFSRVCLETVFRGFMDVRKLTKENCWFRHLKNKVSLSSNLKQVLV
jgi:hypothetical protein